MHDALEKLAWEMGGLKDELGRVVEAANDLPTIDRLLASIETLDGNVGSLGSSLEPIGAVADRVPGNRRTS